MGNTTSNSCGDDTYRMTTICSTLGTASVIVANANSTEAWYSGATYARNQTNNVLTINGAGKLCNNAESQNEAMDNGRMLYHAIVKALMHNPTDNIAHTMPRVNRR